MEDIEEPHERRVVHVTHAFTRIFRQMQWQRPLGAEQAEELHADPRWLRVLTRAKRMKRRRSERERRILREAYRIVRGTKRRAQARLFLVRALPEPQQRIEVEPVRLGLERADKL
jgi:hypothetical protein